MRSRGSRPPWRPMCGRWIPHSMAGMVPGYGLGRNRARPAGGRAAPPPHHRHDTTGKPSRGTTMSEQSSFEERHARATEVFGKFAPEVEPERAARSMERRLGALGTFAFNTVAGDLWCRTELSRRDRSLVVISVLSATARDEELEAHVGVGLNHGLTRVEIEELNL